MDEVIKVISEVLSVVNKAIESIVGTLAIELNAIAEQVIAFIDLTALVIENFAYELLDVLDIYAFDSWVSTQDILDDLDYVLFGIADYIGNYIRGIVQHFESLTSSLLSGLRVELADIENIISVQYQERMFAIYGQIGALSLAINAPPSYLEEAIQNAKMFVLGLSGFIGLTYEQFQIDWFTGLNRLLNRIRNSINLYRQNPRQIRIDLETELIRPAYEIYISAAISRETRDREFAAGIEQTKQDLVICQRRIEENIKAREQLWELTIKPRIEALQTDFEQWISRVYQAKIKQLDTILMGVITDTITLRIRLDGIDERMLYGGDLLQGINLLPIAERIIQESKIAEVTSRQFRRNTELWRSEVESHKEI